MKERYLTRGSEALNRSYALPKTEQEILRKGKKENRSKSRELRYERYAESKFAPTISIAGFVALSIATVLFLYSCVEYLRISDKINIVNAETKAMMVLAQNVKSENDNKENKIYAQVDLEEIREKAMVELGMVYPYKNRVISYRAVNGGYVRQFGEFSGGKNLNLFEKILSMFAVR